MEAGNESLSQNLLNTFSEEEKVQIEMNTNS